LYCSGLPRVRLIDFGSARHGPSGVCTDIQSDIHSCCYHAPEVVLGIPFASVFCSFCATHVHSIPRQFLHKDRHLVGWMCCCGAFCWFLYLFLFLITFNFSCITGHPLFPGGTDYERMCNIMRILGYICVCWIVL
jgi:serine/threonine protein kinase